MYLVPDQTSPNRTLDNKDKKTDEIKEERKKQKGKKKVKSETPNQET